MSTGSIRNPPPLSLPLSAHPLYSEIVRIGKGGGKILDLGCGPGKDLMQLINDGVPAFNVVGMDKESGFQNLISATARREGIPEPIAFVSGDVTTLLPTSNEISEPRLDSWFATHRSTFSVVICNRLLHLLPPTDHSSLLTLLLSSFLTLPNSSSLLLVGLQRALPSTLTSEASSTSGYHSISSQPNPNDTEKHWLWAEEEWDALLESVCAERRGEEGVRVEWGSEFLDGEGVGEGEGRGAVRWWVRVDLVNASS